jgi:hypothetical protein
MKTIHLEAEFGAYLSSRTTAARLRTQIESLADAGQVAFIDMTNVESMSESFADEAFAVLVAARGAEWFKRGVRLESMRPSIRDNILNAVLERRARAAGHSHDKVG